MTQPVPEPQPVQPEPQPVQPEQPQAAQPPEQAAAQQDGGTQAPGGTQVSASADVPRITQDVSGRPVNIPLDPETGAPIEGDGAQ